METDNNKQKKISDFKQIKINVLSAVLGASALGLIGFAFDFGQHSIKIEEMSKDIKKLSSLESNVVELIHKVASLEKITNRMGKISNKLLIEAINNNPDVASDLLSKISMPQEVVRGVELFRNERYSQALDVLSRAAVDNVELATYAYGLSIENLNIKLESGGLDFDALKSELKGNEFLFLDNGKITSELKFN